MSILEERIERLNQVEFFKERSGLAEEMAELEKKIGYKLPLEFEVNLLPKYTIGEEETREAILGKIHTYFIIGLTTATGKWVYKVFENKRMLKYFFTTLDGLDNRDLAFWLKEIEMMR